MAFADSHTFVALIASLRGKDAAAMSPVSLREFRDSSFENFRRCTVFIPTIVQNTTYGEPSEFLHDVTRSEDYQEDWIGRFRLLGTKVMEQAVGQDRLVQHAAATWPAIEITADLFAEYRGSVLNHGAYATFSLECRGDPALELLEFAINEMHNVLREKFAALPAIRLVSKEGAGINIMNPSNISSSFKYAAAAVRHEAQKNDSSLIEALALEIDVDGDTNPSVVTDAFEAMAALFNAVTAAIEAGSGSSSN